MPEALVPAVVSAWSALTVTAPPVPPAPPLPPTATATFRLVSSPPKPTPMAAERPPLPPPPPMDWAKMALELLPAVLTAE